MKINQNIQQIQAQDKREEKIKQVIQSLPSKPKITSKVEAYLQATGLSLKKAIRRGFISVNPRKGIYIVTARGNNYKQRRKK